MNFFLGRRSGNGSHSEQQATDSFYSMAGGSSFSTTGLKALDLDDKSLVLHGVQWVNRCNGIFR